MSPAAAAHLALAALPTLLLAAPAGWAAALTGVPLPWMIGPLLLVAALRIAGVALVPLAGGRQAGQWAIGTALGLYFTPAVVEELARHAALVLAVAGSALLFGLICAQLTRRLSGTDPATAFFASLPGGASEMALLAERHGGAIDLIAAAHAVRVLLVVVAVPFALTFAGAHGLDDARLPVRALEWTHMPLLVLTSLAGVALLMFFGVANAWVLGPLFAVAAASAAELPLSALPAWLVNGGQLLIGCSLGCRFGPRFFHRAPRFMAAAVASALLAMLLATLLALAFAPLARVPVATLALAAAPGGIAEMCITAQVLQLGVPLVTACHVLRVVGLTLGAPPLFRWLSRG